MAHHYFTVEELMLDDSFTNYCLKRNEEDTHKWESIINSHPYSQTIFNEAEQLIRLLHSGLTEKEVDTELQKIQNKIRQQRTPAEAKQEERTLDLIASPEKKFANHIWLYTGVAAGLLVCMFLFFANRNTKDLQALHAAITTISSQPDSANLSVFRMVHRYTSTTTAA